MAGLVGDHRQVVVNGVHVVFGSEGFGVFLPASDPSGVKRPFVVVPHGAVDAAIQETTQRARDRYDLLRGLDGYTEMDWEAEAGK